MQWTVETLNETVDAELEALPTSVRARIVRIAEMTETLGLPALREPHVRQLDGKIWEIRAKAKEGIGRAIYVTVTGKRA